ncbi:MAG TPA: GNAT family N-acetyltransferase [Opitutaceae bacterium]|nr:GNAT family N-acetyltransferase [Opitutaceae bacterium]
MASPSDTSTIQFRALRLDEVDEACALAREVFDRLIAAAQPEQGRRMFHAFAQPVAMTARHKARYATWVAAEGPQLVGVLHIHARNHLSLLFVAPEWQGRGIARRLLRQACDDGGLLAPLTVNSDPHAVSFYSRLGFAAEGLELLKNGVRHQPMRLRTLPPDWCRLGSGPHV